MITLQYYIGFCHTAIWIYTCPLPFEPPSHLPPHTNPLGCHRASDLSSKLHAANFLRLSILHMMMHVFQCYSLKLSRPRHDWSYLAAAAPSLTVPKVCSLCLPLLCCPANKIIIHIYALIYTICLSLSDLLPCV